MNEQNQNEIQYGLNLIKSKIVFYGIIGAHVLFLLLFLFQPSFKSTLDTIYGRAVFGLLILSLITIYMLFAKTRIHIATKAYSVALGFINLIILLIDLGKIKFFFYFLASLVGLMILVVLFLKYSLIETEQIVISTIPLGYSTIAFRFITIDFLTFTITAIIVGVVSFIIIFVLIKTRKQKNTIYNLIITPLVLSLVIAAFTLFQAISMNYYLDRSDPVFETYTIINKENSSTGDSIEYLFHIKNETNSFNLKVKGKDFKKFNSGDEIVVSRYNGAFNKPYYIF